MNLKLLERRDISLSELDKYHESLKLLFIYLEESKDTSHRMLSCMNLVSKHYAEPLMPWLMEHQDNSYVQNYLGGYYFMITNNTLKAFQLFKKSADQGNLLGMFNLGYCYFHGWHVSKDRNIAYDLFLQSKVYYESSRFLGIILSKSEYKDGNYKKMVEYLNYSRQLEGSYNNSSKSILDDFIFKESKQSKVDFDIMNKVSDNSYTYPVIVKEHIEMEDRYFIYKKMHEFFIKQSYIPKELLQIIVTYN